MRSLRAAAVLLAVLSLSSTANAQFFDIDYLLPFQGRLTDSTGSVVADGNHTVTFRIYDDAVAGLVRWTSGPRQVQTRDGLFNVLLGDSTVMDYGLFRSGVKLWLGVTVGSDPELMPRTRLAASPYAGAALSVNGDLRTSRGLLLVGDDPDGGNDSGIVIVTESKSVDHRGHVTILKISNGGSDTSEVLTLGGDPSAPALEIGDPNESDSGVVLTAGKKHKHRGHVTILKISNNGSDTTEVLTLDGDPSAPSMQFGDGGESDSGVVLTAGKKHKHRGHVTILKISNNGSDTTEVLTLDGDPSAPSMQFGDGGESDSGVVLTAGKKHKHRGHVTILKISNNGSDTTEVLTLDGDPSAPSMSFGDGGESDSGVVLTTGKRHKHHGHVTILKISNGGADTTEVLTLDGEPASPSLEFGDGGDPDSSVVLTAGKRHKHHGHVTILKISNGGADTTDILTLSGDTRSPLLQFGDDSDPDSSVVLTTGKRHKHHGHVTILKISNGGADTTEVLTLDGDPASPSMQFGDGGDPDSGLVLTSGKRHKHHGHVTILKISNGGADTTQILTMEGASDTASLQLGGGSGGSVFMRTTGTAGSGVVGVNTLTPGYELDVVGTICATGGMCQQSDFRMKQNIEPLTDGLGAIEALRPVRYDWRREAFADRRLPESRQVGFIAQEVKEVLPELVSQSADGMYAVDYARLAPVLVKALQEQQAQIDELRELVQKLASQLPAETAAQYGQK